MQLAMASMLLVFVLLASVSGVTHGARLRSSTTAAANPIRKVVTMLQNMQKQVEAEGVAEKKLYEKYMCWCKTSGGDLEKEIEAAKAKIAELGPAIKEAEAKKKKLEEDVKQHQEDRAAAKKTVKEATEIRQKEKKKFEQDTMEDRQNLDVIKRA